MIWIPYLELFVNWLQWNIDDSNTDDSFTLDDSKSFLSPYEILSKAQEYKYMWNFLILCEIVCFVYSLELPQWGNSNEYTQHTIIV